MATVIKATTCKCGKSYIDFNDQLGKCPSCTDNQRIAEIQQEILKQFTYLTVDQSFKTIVRMLAQEKLDKSNCIMLPTPLTSSPVSVVPKIATEEPTTFFGHIKKIIRRK